MMSYRVLVFLSFVGLILPSCAAIPSHYRMYSQPPLPKEEVAFLITRLEGYQNYYARLLGKLLDCARVRIYAVDGKTIEGKCTVKIELLPGYHTIMVSYGYTTGPTSANDPSDLTKTITTTFYSLTSVPLSFDTKPGHIYLVQGTQSGMMWHPTITDVTEAEKP